MEYPQKYAVAYYAEQEIVIYLIEQYIFYTKKIACISVLLNKKKIRTYVSNLQLTDFSLFLLF